MELKVCESPGTEWDEFASRYTDLIFYQSVWSEVLRKGLGGQPLYFCLKKGGEVLAGLPGVLLDFKVFKILYASIPYGNLIGEESCFLPFVTLLEKEFQKQGIDQVRLAASPFSKPFSPPSFRPVIAKCTLLDLRRFEETRIRETYRSEIRRAIRKSEKNGLSVRGISTRKETEVFYQLYRSSMEQNRAAAKYPLRWFHAIYELLIEQGKADVLFAMKGDRHTAGVVLVYSSSSLHYLHNGSERFFREYRPNDLIVDHIIRSGVAKGKSFLDFMGSDPNDVSLIRFKEKWGGHSVDLSTCVKDYHALRSVIWEWAKRLGASRIGRGLLGKIRH